MDIFIVSNWELLKNELHVFEYINLVLQLTVILYHYRKEFHINTVIYYILEKESVIAELDKYLSH